MGFTKQHEALVCICFKMRPTHVCVQDELRAFDRHTIWVSPNNTKHWFAFVSRCDPPVCAFKTSCARLTGTQYGFHLTTRSTGLHLFQDATHPCVRPRQELRAFDGHTVAHIKHNGSSGEERAS